MGAQKVEVLGASTKISGFWGDGPTDVCGGHVLLSTSHESMSGLHGLLAEGGRLLG